MSSTSRLSSHSSGDEKDDGRIGSVNTCVSVDTLYERFDSYAVYTDKSSPEAIASAFSCIRLLLEVEYLNHVGDSTCSSSWISEPSKCAEVLRNLLPRTLPLTKAYSRRTPDFISVLIGILCIGIVGPNALLDKDVRDVFRGKSGMTSSAISASTLYQSSSSSSPSSSVSSSPRIDQKGDRMSGGSTPKKPSGCVSLFSSLLAGMKRSSVQSNRPQDSTKEISSQESESSSLISISSTPSQNPDLGVLDPLDSFFPAKLVPRMFQNADNVDIDRRSAELVSSKCAELRETFSDTWKAMDPLLARSLESSNDYLSGSGTLRQSRMYLKAFAVWSWIRLLQSCQSVPYSSNDESGEEQSSEMILLWMSTLIRERGLLNFLFDALADRSSLVSLQNELDHIPCSLTMNKNPSSPRAKRRKRGNSSLISTMDTALEPSLIFSRMMPLHISSSLQLLDMILSFPFTSISYSNESGKKFDRESIRHHIVVEFLDECLTSCSRILQLLHLVISWDTTSTDTTNQLSALGDFFHQLQLDAFSSLRILVNLTNYREDVIQAVARIDIVRIATQIITFSSPTILSLQPHSLFTDIQLLATALLCNISENPDGVGRSVMLSHGAKEDASFAERLLDSYSSLASSPSFSEGECLVFSYYFGFLVALLLSDEKYLESSHLRGRLPNEVWDDLPRKMTEFYVIAQHKNFVSSKALQKISTLAQSLSHLSKPKG